MTDIIPLSEGYDPKARAVPGAYWDRDDKSYLFDVDSATPRTAAVVLKLFPELQLTHTNLVELRDQLHQDVRPFDNATPYNVKIEAPTIREVLAAEDHSFYEYQEYDLGYVAAVLEHHGGAYIGWGRGMGKTLGACALIEDLGLERVLIVAPNTAKVPVWAAETAKWLPEHNVQVLPNPKKQREKLLDNLNGDPIILIVHYESLALIASRRGGWAKFGTWDLIVSDETHRIKNPRAQLTRALKKIKTHRKLALSGSIIENHADELYSPLNWLFPNRYSSRWRDWNDRFLDYVDGGWGRIPVGVKIDKLDELRSELGVFMVYRRKEDELDLPQRTDQTLRVQMSPGQARAYHELQERCLTTLEDESRVAAIEGLPMLSKLRQIATGLDLVGELQDSTKLDLAIDLIEDNEDDATVVFSWYKAAAYALAERLEAKGIECFVITGDVAQKKRSALIKQFQEGVGQVLIGTISTMGESINLQRASNAIFLDRSWNPGSNVQAEDRIYRIGQEKPVTITHIVAQDTVDEYRVMPTIANKEALRRLILGGS